MKANIRIIGFSAVLVVAAGLLLLYLVNSPRVTTDEHVVRVGYKQNSGYQNFFVAIDQQLFEKHGIIVEGVAFQSTNQMLQALALGHIDATAAGSIEVVARMSLEDSNAIRIYLTLVFSKENAFFSLLAPNDSSIEALSDLEGKKVGTIPGSTATEWLRCCVEGSFDPDEVEILQVALNLQLQALVAREVDALYTVDPIVTMGIVNGTARLVEKGPENDHILDTLATGAGLISTRFLDENQESARRFIAAMYDAVDFMRTNEQRTREIIANETRLDVEIADRMDLIDYWKLDETNADVVQQYLDFLTNAGILGQKVDAESLYISQNQLQE